MVPVSALCRFVKPAPKVGEGARKAESGEDLFVKCELPVAEHQWKRAYRGGGCRRVAAPGHEGMQAGGIEQTSLRGRVERLPHALHLRVRECDVQLLLLELYLRDMHLLLLRLQLL